MKKRLRLKTEYKVSLLAMSILLLCAFTLNKIDDGFVENCMNNGYSQNYCERSR